MQYNRIYVGNLPMDVREKDVEDVFYKFGRIRDIDLKTPARPPAFAFVAFEDPRDAEDAVRQRDGYDMDGNRLRVELARGGRGGGGGRGFDGPPRGGGGGGHGGGGRGPPGGGMGGGDRGGRQTEWRVIVTGLPPSASWQDLKDHMRKAGDVVYTDVDHRGGGIVHYGTRDDMDYALRKLDESEFKNPFDKGYIRVLPHRGSRRDSRSRSRSRTPPRRRKRYSSSASRSRSRSPARRARSGSRSASRSPRSRSRDRSEARDKDDKSPVKRDDRTDDEKTNGHADGDAAIDAMDQDPVQPEVDADKPDSDADSKPAGADL